LLEGAPDRRRVRRDEKVLADGEVVEQLDRLPGPEEAALSAAVWGQSSQILAVELDHAL